MDDEFLHFVFYSLFWALFRRPKNATPGYLNKMRIITEFRLYLVDMNLIHYVKYLPSFNYKKKTLFDYYTWMVILKIICIRTSPLLFLNWKQPSLPKSRQLVVRSVTKSRQLCTTNLGSLAVQKLTFRAHGLTIVIQDCQLHMNET